MKARMLIAAVALTATVAASAEPGGRRVRLGGISVSGSYWGGGPGWWGPAWWGPGYWWSPMYYGGWAHPGYWGGFGQAPGMGEVKLPKMDSEATVYLDGAYAGTAGKLRSIWLDPGQYELEIKDEKGRSWQRRIYVLSGRTLDLKPELKEASTR